MSSKDRSNDLKLESDLPTTEADIAAQRRAREISAMSLAEIMEYLSRIDFPLTEERRRRTSAGWEPFELYRE